MYGGVDGPVYGDGPVTLLTGVARLVVVGVRVLPDVVGGPGVVSFGIVGLSDGVEPTLTDVLVLVAIGVEEVGIPGVLSAVVVGLTDSVETVTGLVDVTVTGLTALTDVLALVVIGVREVPEGVEVVGIPGVLSVGDTEL